MGHFCVKMINECTYTYDSKTHEILFFYFCLAGIDYTTSNKVQGMKTFHGWSLHDTKQQKANPYQQVKLELILNCLSSRHKIKRFLVTTESCTLFNKLNIGLQSHYLSFYHDFIEKGRYQTCRKILNSIIA